MSALVILFLNNHLKVSILLDGSQGHLFLPCSPVTLSGVFPACRFSITVLSVVAWRLVAVAQASCHPSLARCQGLPHTLFCFNLATADNNHHGMVYFAGFL